jgi:pyruvate formate lyase activating enzyme
MSGMRDGERRPEADAGRRELLQALVAAGCTACLTGAGAIRPLLAQQDAPPSDSSLLEPSRKDLPYHPARWWKEAGELRVECGLCPKKCRVADVERGACGVRENRGGKYYTRVYGRPCSLHIDPIEKKPFNHVLPGSAAFSLATPGCNFECKFCQNWEIAQARPEQIPTYEVTPQHVASLAARYKTPTIACTYTEPVVYSEYVYDIAVAAKKSGIRTLVVSNGFLQEEPLKDLMEVLGAVKIDLKGYTEKFYKEVCAGELKPVLDTLRRLRKHGTWTEIVVLIVPTLNDGEEEIRGLARFVRGELGADVPLHFTRFHPQYRLQNLPRTPVSTLERARDIAMDEGLQYVYLGNVPGHPGNSTWCPGCKSLLIRRVDMATLENRLQGGRCPSCHLTIPGIWA